MAKVAGLKKSLQDQEDALAAGGTGRIITVSN